MISDVMQKAINDQIKAEFYSAYMYLSMAAYFENRNLPGFAKWLRVQFQEEQTHALKFYDYLIERCGRVELDEINKPPFEWEGNLEAFQAVLEHEQKVTGMINKLYEVALKQKDYATQVMLQWFINEQVEEEKNVCDIIEQLLLIDARGTAVLMLDHQLGKRGGD
jgi:ferritin